MISKSVPARSGSRTFATGVEYITEHEHQRALAAAASSFDGRVDYATALQKAAWLHLRGVSSVRTAAIEMEATAALYTRCEDPVYHLIVAYAKDEHPTCEQVVADAERLLAALNMEDHQYVLSAHQDTDDFHAHVIANRVGPDGKANDLWHEQIIRERVCAEIAAERGWEIVVGHHNRDIVQRMDRLHAMPEKPARRMSDAAYRKWRERGEQPWEDLARPYILDAVDRAESWEELHQRLHAHGVVLKRVERGGRVQGLAFVEGWSSHAPGCGASRIDARCTLSVLERRFGQFAPMREPERETAALPSSGRTEDADEPMSSRQWGDAMRETILAEVDAARSWEDLTERLRRHGVLIKLVERGGYVQGLAFVAGEHPDAPGCGASRIDPRCKKATLEERFGPFPRAARDAAEERSSDVRDERASGDRKSERPHESRERQRADQRERGASRGHGWAATAAGKAASGSDRAVHEAERIAEHARMRSEYEEYRKRFHAERRRANDAGYAAAWERERARREEEAQRRKEARTLLRSAARWSRGPVRQLAYWSIDAVMDRRREREFAAAHQRWEMEKIVLRAQRGRQRAEQPMDYETFVVGRARAGDAGARRVQEDLTRSKRRKEPARAEQTADARRPTEAKAQPRTWTIDELHAHLDAVRKRETARYEQARWERDELSPEDESRDFVDVEGREEEIRAAVTARTAFTMEEQARLQRFVEDGKSWNPLTRQAAKNAEETLRAEQRQRYEMELREAVRRFNAEELPYLTERGAERRRQHECYVEHAYELEERMKAARAVIRDRVEASEEKLEVIERAGIRHVVGLGESPNLEEVCGQINRCFDGIPEATRRAIIQCLRDKRRQCERMRGSPSIDE